MLHGMMNFGPPHWHAAGRWPSLQRVRIVPLNAHETNFAIEDELEHHPSVFRCLAIISGLNYAVVGPQLPNILQACATVAGPLFPRIDAHYNLEPPFILFIMPRSPSRDYRVSL